MLLNNILVDRVIAVNANNPLLNPFWPDIGAAKRFLAEALAAKSDPGLRRSLASSARPTTWISGLQIPATMQASGGVAHEVPSLAERVGRSACTRAASISTSFVTSTSTR